MTAISAAAQANVDILRRIRRADEAAGRPCPIEALQLLRPDVRPFSLKRTLDRLIDDGLLSVVHGEFKLTDTGERVLLALDIADGAGMPAGVPLAQATPDRWPLDRCYPNPDNPARPVDEERDANFRESIVQAGDLLQPVALSPPDASGARMIWIGHRRWEQCRILREEGRLPPALAEGLPFKEWDAGPDREGHRVEALKLALMENVQRADVPPWEDAKQLALYAELTGKPARQVALDLGRANPGSEKGVADVQQKIATVRKARPEWVAAHEAGEITWEELRERCREKKAATAPGTDLSPKQLLCLVEAYDYAARRGVEPGKAGEVPILDYGAFGGDYGLVQVSRFGFSSRRGGGWNLWVFDRVWAEIERLGHLYRPEEDPQARAKRLLDLRCTVVSEARAFAADRDGTYITGWLNLPIPAQAEAVEPEDDEDDAPPPPAPAQAKGVIDPDNELIVDGQRFPNIAYRDEYLRRLRGEGGAGSPARPKPADPLAAITLTPSARLAMFELAHLLEAGDDWLSGLPGGATYAVPVGRYWLSRDFADLKAEPLALIIHHHTQSTGGRPYVAFTDRGVAWLEAEGFEADPDGLLALARAQAGVTPPEDGSWNTDWLNVEAAESRPLEADPDDDERPPLANPSPAPSGEGGPRSGSDEGSAGGGHEATEAILQTLGPDARALATLWVAASGAFDVLCRMEDAAFDPDTPPIPDAEFHDRRVALQMALMASAERIPKGLRASAKDPRPIIDAADPIRRELRILGQRADDCPASDTARVARILADLSVLADLLERTPAEAAE